MLATFCLRLACGLMLATLLLPPSQVNPRFFRTQVLTVLGLTAVASALLREAVGSWLWIVLAASMLTSFLGSVVWSIADAPFGRWCTAFASLCLVTSVATATRIETTGLGSAEWSANPDILASAFASTLVLGFSTTAMLMGHSYLIAPSMSLVPLYRLLAGLFLALLARAAVSAMELSFWTTHHSLSTLNDVTLLLPLRWGIGLVAPSVLGWLALQTTRIRSTQSATGILYVVVIFCFLGEVLGQALFQMTGSSL